MNFLEKKDYSLELETDIIIGRFKGPNIDLRLAQTIVKDRLSIFNGRKYPVLVIMKSLKNIDKEARDFLASEKGCEGLLAGAIFVNSILENTIANLFLSLTNPLVPTKIFTDEKKAREWLHQFV